MEVEENYGSFRISSTLTSSSKDESELRREGRGASQLSQAHSAGFFHLSWPHPEGPVEVLPKSPLEFQKTPGYGQFCHRCGGLWVGLGVCWLWGLGVEEGMVRLRYEMLTLVCFVEKRDVQKNEI